MNLSLSAQPLFTMNTSLLPNKGSSAFSKPICISDQVSNSTATNFSSKIGKLSCSGKSPVILTQSPKKYVGKEAQMLLKIRKIAPSFKTGMKSKPQKKEARKLIVRIPLFPQ